MHPEEDTREAAPSSEIQGQMFGSLKGTSFEIILSTHFYFLVHSPSLLICEGSVLGLLLSCSQIPAHQASFLTIMNNVYLFSHPPTPTSFLVLHTPRKLALACSANCCRDLFDLNFLWFTHT